MEEQKETKVADANISDEIETATVTVNKKSKKEEVIEEQKATPQNKAPGFKIAFPTEEKKYIKMLIYGDYGTGKTFFCGTAQDVKEMRNVLNIDAEGGNKVLANRGDIPSIRVKKFSELSAIFEYLRAHCLFRDTNNTEMLKASEAYFRGVDVKEIKKPRIYNTVMVDSISEVARYCMYDLLGIDIDKVKLDDQLAQPEYKEWNSLMEKIRLLIRKFRDLPMHTFFVASRQWDKDEQNRQLFTPNVQGKLANEIQGFMDHVGYYTLEKNEANEVHRFLILQPGRTYQAKNRFSKFTGVYIQDPIMEDIYELEVLNKSVPSRIEQAK